MNTKKLLICEKPSVQREIANVLGCKKKGGNYENEEFVVATLAGHIMKLKEFKDYPEIKKYETDGKLIWSRIKLPFVPEKFIYEVVKEKVGLYKNILETIKRDDVSVIYNVGDPGPEGQALVDNPIIASRTTKPVKRLFLNSISYETVMEAIQKDIDNKSKKCRDLYNSARTRAEIDWTFGMNLSIYSTVKAGGNLMMVGRVKVPIIEYIYTRDKIIDEFVPEKYYSVESKKEIQGYKMNLVCKKTYIPEEKEKAEEYAKLLNRHEAIITDIETKQVKKQAKPLWNANSFKPFAAKKLGISPKIVEQKMQEMYEQGYITYPRSESQHLSIGDVPKIRTTIAALNNSKITMKEETRIFNESKIIDGHGAIIPTSKIMGKESLDELAYRIYSLIRDRFMANFSMEECIVEETTIEITVGPEKFRKKGEILRNEGHSIFEKVNLTSELPDFRKGQKFDVDFTVLEKFTTPPAKINGEMLNSYLDNPFKDEKDYGKQKLMSEEEFQQALNGVKIGTSATRTRAITECVEGGYISYDPKTTIYSITESGKIYIENLNVLNINLSKERSVELNSNITKIMNGLKKPSEAVEEIKKELERIIRENEEKGIETQKLKGQKGKVITSYKGENVFRNELKDGKAVYSTPSRSVVIYSDTYIFGTKVNLNENQVKNLLDGQSVKFKLYSKKKEKEYEAEILFKRMNDKGYPEFDFK